MRSNRGPCLLHPFLSIFLIKEPTHLFENGPSQGLGDCYEPAVILDLYCCGDPAKLENLNKLNYTSYYIRTTPDEFSTD